MAGELRRLIQGDATNLKGQALVIGKSFENKERMIAGYTSHNLKDLQNVLTTLDPYKANVLNEFEQKIGKKQKTSLNFCFLDYDSCKDSKIISVADIIDCGEYKLENECRLNIFSNSIEYILIYEEQIIQKKVDFVNQRIVEEEFSKYLKIQELTKGQREKYALLIHLFDQFIGACVSGKRIDENYGDQILERLYSKHSNDSYQESIQRIVRRILYTPFTEKTLDIISEEVIQICKQKIKNPWENN